MLDDDVRKKTTVFRVSGLEHNYVCLIFVTKFTFFCLPVTLMNLTAIPYESGYI